MVPDGQDLQRFSFMIVIIHSFNKHACSAYECQPHASAGARTSHVTQPLPVSQLRLSEMRPLAQGLTAGEGTELGSIQVCPAWSVCLPSPWELAWQRPSANIADGWQTNEPSQPERLFFSHLTGPLLLEKLSQSALCRERP